MSVTLILFILATVLMMAAIVMHIMMVVHGFKNSVAWGLICLFVPVGSMVFAFGKFGRGTRRVFAFVFLIVLLGGIVTAVIASYQTAMAAVGSEDAAIEGMKEVEAQIQDLEKMDDIQLDL